MPTSDQTVLDPVTIPQIVATSILPFADDYFEVGGVTRGSSKTKQNNFPQQVADLVALAALDVANVASGTVVLALASTAFGDHGGGFFKFVSGSTTTPDGGTVIAPTGGGGRWFRVFIPLTFITWFGAKGDGTTNDQAAYDAAYAYLVAGGGGTLFFPKGSYVLNALVTANNITLSGTMGTAELKQVCLIPADATKATLTIGNDTGYVRNTRVEGLAIYGITNAAAQAVAAVRLAGGAYHARFDCCNFSGGQKTFWAEGGDTYPATVCTVTNFALRADYNDAAALGIYIKRHAGSYTTGISFVQGHINGQNAGYAVKLDAEVAFFTNVYCDFFPGHGVATMNGAHFSSGGAVRFDCPSGAVITALDDTVKDPTRYLDGQIQIDVGNLLLSDASTVVLDGSYNFSPQSWNRTIKIGQTGTPLTRVLRATGSIDFGVVGAGASSVATLAVVGAGVGDSVIVNVVDAGGPYNGLTHDAWVSATDVVSVRAINFTAAPINPSAQTFGLTVISFS